MRRFIGSIAFLLSAYAGAAEYVYLASGLGSSSFYRWMYDMEVLYTPPGDSVPQPLLIGTTLDVLIKVTVQPGSDSLTWQYLSHTMYTLGPNEGPRVTCRTCTLPPGLAIMLNGSGSLGGQVSDTQTVTISGTAYSYYRHSTPSPQRDFPNGSYVDVTELSTIGRVYYEDGRYGGPSGTNINRIRLISYNGINLDSLWGTTLPGPTSLSPVVKKPAGRSIAPRRFTLREMDVFRGRRLPNADRP